MKINLNEFVKVKLTRWGVDLYRMSVHRGSIRMCIDENGYAELQWWQLMKLYGNHIGWGRALPFYMEVEYEPQLKALSEAETIKQVDGLPCVKITPEQAVAALVWHANCKEYEDCDDCPAPTCDHDGLCAYTSKEWCLAQAAALIQQLEARLAEYEKPLVPLTLYEAKAKNMERLPLYMECSFTELWHGLHPFNGWVVGLGWMRSWGSPDDEPVGFIEEGYGTYWRCWSRKPTDEERKAAKWDENA